MNNLFEMTRLESGAVEVKRDWHSLEEIIGAALTRVDVRCAAARSRFGCPSTCR